jgi:hypothetical protein
VLHLLPEPGVAMGKQEPQMSLAFEAAKQQNPSPSAPKEVP